jgi:hypothetical protein
VDDLRARFVILLLGDPHLLKGGQRSEDRSTDPDGVQTLFFLLHARFAVSAVEKL